MMYRIYLPYTEFSLAFIYVRTYRTFFVYVVITGEATHTLHNIIISENPGSRKSPGSSAQLFVPTRSICIVRPAGVTQS